MYKIAKWFLVKTSKHKFVMYAKRR